jgi:hypothetical protein
MTGSRCRQNNHRKDTVRAVISFLRAARRYRVEMLRTMSEMKGGI